jgi:hypothetical protein
VIKRIVRALKPQGILELMVYNKGSWTLPANFQKAMRLLCRHEDRPHLETELPVAQALVDHGALGGAMGRYLVQYRHCPTSMVADALLQPVLHSYTVESFAAMAQRCGLQLLQPYVSQFDKSTQTLSWNMQFEDREIQRTYDALPDLERWKISNLLQWECAPSLLWFYFQRQDAGLQRPSEADICEAFLASRFQRCHTSARVFLRRDDHYLAGDIDEPYPGFRPAASVHVLLERADGKQPMKDLLPACGIDLDFASVNRTRILTTTSEFPFLRALH